MPRAGLTPASVTEAGAALVDEIGFDQLSMGLLAERLGVKTPSLYKHVTSQADLAHRIAILAMTELGDAIRDAIQGRAGSDALAAGAQAMRTYVREHPGRYAAAQRCPPDGPDDPFIPASDRVLSLLGGHAARIPAGPRPGDPRPADAAQHAARILDPGSRRRVPVSTRTSTTASPG